MTNLASARYAFCEFKQGGVATLVPCQDGKELDPEECDRGYIRKQLDGLRPGRARHDGLSHGSTELTDSQNISINVMDSQLVIGIS